MSEQPDTPTAPATPDTGPTHDDSIPLREHPVARSRAETLVMNTIDLGDESPFSI